MNQGENVSTRNDAIVPPSNGQCIVLESGCIRPQFQAAAAAAVMNSTTAAVIRWLASQHCITSYTIACWPSSTAHAHIKPISGLSEITTPIANATLLPI